MNDFQEKNIQQTINKTWTKEWQNQLKSHGDVFKNRLFVEGYSVFKKYIPADSKKILDVGGGTGRYGIALAKDFPESHVVITDILPEAVEIAEILKKDLNIKNVETKVEDVFDLSFEDNVFDIVFCDVVIQHLPNCTDAVNEMVRVLKPGGRVIISAVNFWNVPHSLYKFTLKVFGKEYPYGREKSFTKKELRNLMKNNGLQIIAEDGFYFAYGVFRLKYINSFFKIAGKTLNRMVKFADSISGRVISKNMGFEIFIVAQK